MVSPYLFLYLIYSSENLPRSLLPDHAGIQQDYISFTYFRCLRISEVRKHTYSLLTVVNIHLASVCFKIDFFFHG